MDPPPAADPGSELMLLLQRARDADPADRIELRDDIASHGEPAIEAMTEWLYDPALGAFAIRVLRWIAAESPLRAQVLEVLRAVDRTELAAHLNRDLDEALAGLDPRP